MIVTVLYMHVVNVRESSQFTCKVNGVNKMYIVTY